MGSEMCIRDRPISHELWNQVLINYVDVSGKVNYQGLKEDPKILLDYLELLCTNRPNEELWDERELLAYWINLYNAFTIKLIIDHYPIKSIKNITGKPITAEIMKNNGYPTVSTNKPEYPAINFGKNNINELKSAY